MYRQTLIDELVISSYYERYRIAYQGYIAEVEHVPEAVTTVSKVICKIHSDKIPFTERLLLLSTHNIHILELPKPQHFDDLDHVKLDIKHALKGKYILKKLSEIIIYESLTENVSIQSTQSTSTYDNENDALNLTCKIVPTSLCYMRLKVDCDVVELIFTKSADYHNLLAKLSHVKPTITKLPEALLKSINITTLQCDKFDKVLSLGWEQLSVYSFDWQKGEESAPETHEFGMLEKVTFGENLTVLVKFKDSKEKSLTFLSDSSLQSFKRALAQALYNLENSGQVLRDLGNGNALLTSTSDFCNLIAKFMQNKLILSDMHTPNVLCYLILTGDRCWHSVVDGCVCLMCSIMIYVIHFSFTLTKY